MNCLLTIEKCKVNETRQCADLCSLLLIYFLIHRVSPLENELIESEQLDDIAAVRSSTSGAKSLFRAH